MGRPRSEGFYNLTTNLKCKEPEDLDKLKTIRQCLKWAIENSITVDEVETILNYLGLSLDQLPYLDTLNYY